MNKYHLLIGLFLTGLIISAIQPHDYFTWMLEVFPAIIGFIILTVTFKYFRFTTLVYVLVLLHCYIMFIGGHYTYAQVPVFNWIRDVFHQSRNNYDKVGHFIQGFVPALIVREIFIRKSIVKGPGWLAFLTVCVCATISMCYEFLEWFVSIASGSSGDDFLGTQGYVWDTQSDMLMAVIGAVCAILLLGKYHNKLINKIH